ncbi:hypothetical protein [Pseudomonas sp.]|uniref:hypothetical protein n=1 Tax=Pseudomonas sp. TaxID=306 RepID=UPI002629891F|nr:hypothetical protein [Pseudomonas sp.]
MIFNFDTLQARLTDYVYIPDSKFKLTNTGFSSVEAGLAQKSRQYWADKTVTNEVRLEGLDFDLSAFDGENSTTREMMALSVALSELGVIDEGVCSIIGTMNCEFNSSGNQINFGKKIDAFAYLRFVLEDTKKYIEEGHGFAKQVLVSMNTALVVMLAIKERAEASRANALIDTKA